MSEKQEHQDRTSLTVERLAATTSKPGWDDESAAPIPRAIWDMTLQFCHRVEHFLPSLPEPFLSPSADNTVVVSWTLTPTREAAVEIGESSVHWEMRDTSGAFDSGACGGMTDAFDVLLRLVSKYGG